MDFSSSSSFHSALQSFSSQSPLSNPPTPSSSLFRATHLPVSSFMDPPIFPSSSLPSLSLRHFAEQSQSSSSDLDSSRVRGCDVYIGLSTRKPSILRFVRWLRTELEMQGVSCFVANRARCRSAQAHCIARGAMDAAAFGVVLIGAKTFSNPYSMEEVKVFLDRKKLVPIFFGLSQGECVARDIVERRGEVWEKFGGEIWEVYGGLEKEWKEAVSGLSALDVKFEVNEDNYRDCVLEVVALLGSGLGRRRVVERMRSWKKLAAAAEELPFPRNDKFVGRKKELLDLELELFSGKGTACVSGASGIGKTELLLEFAYRFSQRYKMILWVSGESMYLGENYMKLLPLLGVDMSIENKLISGQKNGSRSFEDIEEEAVGKVRKELMRDVPYLLIIDNLEREKDWWDGRSIMQLLPRFGGATHVLISTQLPRVANIEPMRLSHLSSAEAMSLMKGTSRDLENEEINALRIIEKKLGRLPLGLSLVGAILNELPMNPCKLLDTINSMPYRDVPWNSGEDLTLKQNPFLVQLLDFCFSTCDGETGKLAMRMVQASGLFAPLSVPESMLALAAASEAFADHHAPRVWRKCRRCLTTCMFMSRSSFKNAEAQAKAMLLKFGIARRTSKIGCFSFHNVLKLYARKGANEGVASSVVRAISTEGSFLQHAEHIWAACFLLFKFGSEQVASNLPLHELLTFIERLVLPMATISFGKLFRCRAVLELLLLATETLEALENSFLSEANSGHGKSCTRRSTSRSALQSDPLLYKRFAHLRATLLETRANFMLKGGQYDIGEILCQTAVSIKEVIYGWEHPETISSRKILDELRRLQR